MKILGFYITRRPAKVEVEVRVPQPTLGEACVTKVWQVDVGRDERSLWGRWRHDYFASCVEANEIHPGKSGRQVELLTIGGKHYTCGELNEVVVFKPKVAKG